MFLRTSFLLSSAMLLLLAFCACGGAGQSTQSAATSSAAQQRYIYFGSPEDNRIEAHQLLRGGSLAPVAGSPFSFSGLLRPVHLVADPTAQHLFVSFHGGPIVNEDATLSFAVDRATGRLTETSTVAPVGVLSMHPSGSFLFVGTGVAARVETLAVAADGALSSSASP